MEVIGKTMLERIELILVEEANKKQNVDKFIEKASLRLLELVQNEIKYGK